MFPSPFGIMPPENPLISIVKPVEQIEVSPAEVQLSIEEKIASNYFECDESIEYIRADNATCLTKPTYSAPESVSVAKATNTPVATRTSNTANLYAPGNCTFFAKMMRPDLPNNLGNANTWASRAAAQGYATGTAPRVGSIAQKNMHVVYVTSVNNDGTFNLSEWNYRNLYEQTNRTVSAVGWTFIYN